MTPLAELIASSLRPGMIAVTVFLEWWLLWFILGRPFRETLLMALAARTASLGAAALLLASGAVGPDGSLPAGDLEVIRTVETPWAAWAAACAASWLMAVAVEAAVVGWIMRRRRRSWRWNRYDLGALAAAHGGYVVLAALLA